VLANAAAYRLSGNDTLSGRSRAVVGDVPPGHVLLIGYLAREKMI
jgi:hypothetical protein